MGPWGSNPGPPHQCKAFAMAALPACHTLLLMNYMVCKLYMFDLYVCRWRVSPDPWFCYITYDPVIAFVRESCVITEWSPIAWFMYMTMPSVKWRVGICVVNGLSPRFHCVAYDHNQEHGGSWNGFNSLALFLIERGHMTLTCPSARRLGAGAPITILQFAPLAWLRPVLGFHALNCVCARFMTTRVHFVDVETTSLKRGLLGGLTS
jgi:hypothetical protein